MKKRKQTNECSKHFSAANILTGNEMTQKCRGHKTAMVRIFHRALSVSSCMLTHQVRVVSNDLYRIGNLSSYHQVETKNIPIRS